MKRFPVLVLLFLSTRLCAQVPPPLTPAEIARLRSVKAWDIEYTYHKSDTRNSGGSLDPAGGYGFAGKAIDGWILSYMEDFGFSLTGTIAGKNGQSDCKPGSDSCVIKYTYPASFGSIAEHFNRFEESHFPQCCPDGMGGYTAGSQSLRVTLDITGSKTLDGIGANWIRGALLIDYNVNPPIAEGYFNSQTIGGTTMAAYAGWYRSDTMISAGGTGYDVDLYPYDSTMTRVTIENGRFVIRGSYTYNYDYVPCPTAWVQCDSNTRAGTANVNTTQEWVITSHPDSAITVTRPSEDDLFISGETDTIRWLTDAVDSLRILYSTDSGRTYALVADGIPAAERKYPWAVPETLSRKCRIRIESMIDTARYDTSGLFKMKGYVLTRITAAGDYEAFTPVKHAWSVPNTSYMFWPPSWWNQFDYQAGTDPYTGVVYPPSLFGRAASLDFPDWPLWVRTYGVDDCYAAVPPQGDSAGYRYSAFLLWAMRSDTHHGSCEGLAVSAAAAFGNRTALLGAFPGLGSFGDIAEIVPADSSRLVVNQLQNTQFSRAVQENESLPYNRQPDEAWIDTLKSIFLSEDRSRDMALGLYSPRGAHAMTPYKITRDSGAIPGEPYYLIGVYDPNKPGDASVAMIVRASDGFWRYPVDGIADFIHYGYGLKLNPFPLYLSGVTLPPFAASPGARPVQNPAVHADAPSSATHIARMEVMTSTDVSVAILDPGGDSTGYADSTAFSTIPGADPIMVKTGYPGPPIGYMLPDSGGPYQARLDNFTDTSSRFLVITDSIILGYTHSDAGPGQSAGLAFDKNFFEFTNQDAAAKGLELLSILVDPIEDRVVRISDYTLSGGGISTLQVGGNGNTELRHAGAATTYVLQEILSREGEHNRLFRSGPIPVNAGATHTILSDWTDLAGEVTILVDEGSDGSVDDSTQASNVLVGVGDDGGGVPVRFGLHRNYPNPFNPGTRIAYEIPATVHVTLSVCDVLGREVGKLVDAVTEPGRYEAIFDAGALPGGVYFYTLRAGSFSGTGKMVVLK